MEQSQICLFEDLSNEELIATEGGNGAIGKAIMKLIEWTGAYDFFNDVSEGIIEGYNAGRKDFK